MCEREREREREMRERERREREREREREHAVIRSKIKQTDEDKTVGRGKKTL